MGICYKQDHIINLFDARMMRVLLKRCIFIILSAEILRCQYMCILYSTTGNYVMWQSFTIELTKIQTCFKIMLA